MKIVYFYFIISYIYTFYAYANFHIFCVDDYVTNINYSGGIIDPLNPDHSIKSIENNDYIYHFSEFKHNFKEYICINFVNVLTPGCFSFYDANINEYDITLLNYTNFYICNGCNMNTKSKYLISGECNNRPYIHTSYINDWGFLETKFCLKPTNDISIFNTGENNVNKKYYKRKNNLKFILNYDIDYFYIDKIFSINHNPDYIIYLDTLSYRIKDITNKKGHLYNGKNEIFLNTVFNPEHKFLIYNKSTFDDGYIMTIKIETRTRLTKNNISYLTCEEPANLYIYISQRNCTMINYSNNFCQLCKENYGKYGNKCYYKYEKFENLYNVIYLDFDKK